MPPREEIAPKDNAKPVSEEWMGIGLELGRPLCYVTSRTPLKIEQTTAFPYSQKSHSYLSGGSIKKKLSFFKYLNLKPDSSDYCSDKAQYFCHLTPSQPKKHPPFFKQQVFLKNDFRNSSICPPPLARSIPPLTCFSTSSRITFSSSNSSSSSNNNNMSAVTLEVPGAKEQEEQRKSRKTPPGTVICK